MRHLSRMGTSVICTIHQPSSDLFQMFDRILLMSEGRVAFLGKVKDALSFFSSNGYPCPPNYNPADFFISTLAVVPGQEVSCKNKVNIICDAYEKSEFRRHLQQQLEDSVTQDQYCNGKEKYFHSNRRKKKSPYKADWSKQFNAVLWRSWILVVRDSQLLRARLIYCLV